MTNDATCGVSLFLLWSLAETTALLRLNTSAPIQGEMMVPDMHYKPSHDIGLKVPRAPSYGDPRIPARSHSGTGSSGLDPP
ncbi:hypothetical protein F5B18DRAFT_403083 [Nemania serpens]|nr:hypothetical protein F5B18DRAFT_403083 [Nemania serpens]